MFQSFLLRLVRRKDAEGGMVGQVQVVTTGETIVVRSAGELVEALGQRLDESEPDPAPPPGIEPKGSDPQPLPQG